MFFAYIGPGPGFAVQAPALALVAGVGAAGLAILTLPLRRLFRRPLKRGPASARRVVVLGLDGLEPTLAEQWMAEGKLPNLQRLHYQRLATTCPPLSPVAWSSFATGVNPGKHGIFGFLHRTRDFRPFLSFSQVVKGRPVMLRKSKTFWKVLGEHGVFSHVLRVPVSWPAEPFHGAMLSAMGVPDLRGSQGLYTLIGTIPEELREGVFVPLIDNRAVVKLDVGTCEIRLTRRGDWFLGPQPLALDTYTPWVELRFGRARGIARFRLLQADPVRLYMTPIQIDPERPTMPVSYPRWYSVALSKLLGRYATCGLAEDTGGLEDGVLSEAAFLEQAYAIHEERERQFVHALERSRDGLCAVVFDGTDRIQHMSRDPVVLQELYQRMDALVGRTAAQMGPEDALIVMSDHGFKPLRRTLDLNAWLQQEGYLVGSGTDIDWSRTQAYALGLASLHCNVRGRDADGIVEDLAALKAELQQRLQALVDPETGEHPIAEVFDSARVYTGPYLERGPDLVIGYQLGYRISKAAARGEVGSAIFETNTSAWGADHCLHPAQVPGVLFCNRPLADGADIRDVAPTVLQWFGVDKPAYMEGRCL